jgi:dienelactone hydrolase
VAQEFTRWLGYWKGFNRFEAAPGQFPPNDGVVVDYTIRRNAWVVQWVAANLPVDPHRVVLTGHSQGGSGGSLNVRTRPELYSTALLFAGTVRTFKSNLTDEMQGSADQNLPTNLRDSAGQTIGVDDLYFPTTLATTHEPAMMRFQWGVNDDVVEFAEAVPDDPRAKPAAINALAALPLGAHCTWDERNHAMEDWAPAAHHWVGISRHSAEYLTRYRNDQSFPAFWNDQHADNDPDRACPTNPQITQKLCTVTGDTVNWGTRGGYFEWDVDTITDTATNWAATLFLLGSGAKPEEVPAFNSATANVTIRRAQQFKPGAGTTLHWRFTDVANPATVFQSGTTQPDAAGLVTVSNLTVFKDPQKGRLEFSTQLFPGGPADPPSTQLGLRAWHAHGQTWLVWNEQHGLTRRDTYDIYVSAGRPGALADMRLVGRLLPDDWRATRLKRAGDLLTWAVPDGQGGLKRLAAGEAVFAYTPHAATPEYFAVVKHGESALGAGNLTGPIAQTLDPVTCHAQHTGAVNGHPFTDYAVWIDGRADHASGRADFPVMGNQHFNGTAHLFRVYAPKQSATEPRPAFVFLHGGEGAWNGNQAGETGGADLTPEGGWQINFDDNLIVAYPDRVETHQATKWAGYWESFDRFDTNRVKPPNGSLIVTYTLRRNAWTVEWILRNHPFMDPDRVVMGGHSMGGSGGNVNLRYRPDLYSAGLLFNGSTIITTPDDTPFLLGVAEQQLPCDLPAIPGGTKPTITDLYAPWWRIVPGDIPLQVLVWGVNDPVSEWEPPRLDQSKKPYALTQLNANRIGALVYWDEREHGLDDAVGHWAGPNPNQRDGTARHSADYMRRFRRNQSFPALSNDSHARSSATDFEKPYDNAANLAGHNWGTQGGYHNWDVDTLADTPTQWAVTLWLTGASDFATDIAPFDSAVADVSVRRAQQFKPAPGALLDWKFTRLDNGGLLQSGQVSVGADGLVTVPALTVFKDPLRGRLEITPAPTNRVHVIEVAADGTMSPARVEIFSGDTVEWRFAVRGQAIIPVRLDANGRPDCAHPLPYDPANPNEFTGPLPQAASGLFSLSPEETPYRSLAETWASPNLTGVFIRARWDDVHTGPGQFNWTEIDAEIAHAVRHGKLFSIAFKAGVKGTPKWIFDPARTTAPVVPLDFGLRSEGQPALYGSPADPNFRQHYFDLLRAFAAHLRANNAHYRALAYIKPSGANLHTHENRLPNDTTEQLATWAGPGRYTPSALYEFYRLQEELLAAEFPGKSLCYALIQDGFPVINDFGEYLGQPTTPLHPLPASAEQTEEILAQGRARLGLRFVVAHNGLLRKPAFCPGSGTHPIIVDPNFHYVGSGCPNRWVLEQAALGQVTGYQTINDLLTDGDVDSALQNAWDNSDGIYVELYERNALQIEGKVLPSGKTSGQWAEDFHARRRANFPQLGDPFPLVHRHTFTRSGADSGTQVLTYVTGNPCPGDAASLVGEVVILPTLWFTEITVLADRSVRLTLQSAVAGTLRLEASSDLKTWSPARTLPVAAGITELTETATEQSPRFYRASVTP